MFSRVYKLPSLIKFQLSKHIFHRISTDKITSDLSRFVSKISQKYNNISIIYQEHGVHSQHTDSSNSGFLNSAKEWASELLSGQTKGGKVQHSTFILSYL